MSFPSPRDPSHAPRLPDEVACAADTALPEPFLVPGPGRLSLRPDCNSFDMRHGLELSRLLAVRPAAAAAHDPALAGLAAARTALLAGQLDMACGLCPALPANPWIPLLRNGPPDAAALARAWSLLAAHQPGAAPTPAAGTGAALRRLWPLLGPAEWLMTQGGDARLRLDPDTGLNAYGCGCRPRPRAVSYASSTASTVSERGLAEAEAARRRLLAAAMRGEDMLAEEPLAEEAGAVRAALAGYFGAPDDCGAVLAASGTDCGLFTLALALADRAAGEPPATCIVLAPEETGSGTPLAILGRHFADGTALGRPATRNGTLAGYPADTRLAPVPARGPDGAPRPAAAIEADCAAALRAAPGRVLLLLVDVSKTGLLLPDPGRVAALVAPHAGRVRVAVDACQARLDPARVGVYLRAGWMVQVTGSKFYTGPPFAGALLLPAWAMRHLATGAALPAGLRDYALRAEWPPCAAADGLDAGANPGLLLRWRAALAEMRAFAAVPAIARRRILSGFLDAVRTMVADHPDLLPIAAPPPRRAPLATGEAGPDWDTLGGIVGFAIRDRDTGSPLDPQAARAVYELLNADLSPALPRLGPERAALARLPCHIGQPVALPAPGGGSQGVLRLSAGARLVSGEPGEEAWPPRARLDREIADAGRVLRKLSLIMDHRRDIAPGACRPRY